MKDAMSPVQERTPPKGVVEIYMQATVADEHGVEYVVEDVPRQVTKEKEGSADTGPVESA